MRQPRWECLATFITSSMKQVAHIRQISSALRKRFGTGLSICGTQVYAFPSAEKLAGLTEKELRDCGLGYRAKNLLATAQRVASGEADLESWRALPDDELRAQLLRAAGRRPEGGQLRDALRLRAVTRFPDRRLDRACLAAEIFSAPAQDDGTAVAGVHGEAFRRARRLCPAVSFSPRAQDNPAPVVTRRKVR